MRRVFMACAFVLTLGLPVAAFQPSPAVLRMHEASLGVPDSSRVPMDDCCALHEALDSYFLEYPPELWWDIPVSLQLIECQGDTHCVYLYTGRLRREQSLQDALAEYVVTWYTTDTFEQDAEPVYDNEAALARAQTFSHEPLYE